MSKRIPRLEVIEAFIEAARAPSFRVAADRCALSPAAFSRRIQAFTEFVGRPVFQRGVRGMVLTDAGRECVAGLEPCYTEMRRAALELKKPEPGETVSISLSHSLAVSWLIPRLEAFYKRHPSLEVAIVTTRSAEAVRSGAADLGVCATDVDLAGLRVEHLLDVYVAPVACAAVARDFAESGGVLSDQRLLTITQHPDLWSWWAREIGGDGGDDLRAAATFDMAQALYEAAAAGLGIASGMDVTVGPHLAGGRLVELGFPWVLHPAAYRLAVRPSRMRSPKVAALWSWLLDQARRDNLVRAQFGAPRLAAG